MLGEYTISCLMFCLSLCRKAKREGKKVTKNRQKCLPKVAKTGKKVTTKSLKKRVSGLPPFSLPPVVAR